MNILSFILTHIFRFTLFPSKSDNSSHISPKHISCLIFRASTTVSYPPLGSRLPPASELTLHLGPAPFCPSQRSRYPPFPHASQRHSLRVVIISAIGAGALYIFLEAVGASPMPASSTMGSSGSAFLLCYVQCCVQDCI